jgi:hypothetical protein
MHRLRHIQPYGCDPNGQGSKATGCDGEFKDGRKNKKHWIVVPKVLEARVWNSNNYPSSWDSGGKIRQDNQSSADTEKARTELMQKMNWGSWPEPYEFAFFDGSQDFWGVGYR